MLRQIRQLIKLPSTTSNLRRLPAVKSSPPLPVHHNSPPVPVPVPSSTVCAGAFTHHPSPPSTPPPLPRTTPYARRDCLPVVYPPTNPPQCIDAARLPSPLCNPRPCAPHGDGARSFPPSPARRQPPASCPVSTVRACFKTYWTCDRRPALGSHGVRTAHCPPVRCMILLRAHLPGLGFRV